MISDGVFRLFPALKNIFWASSLFYACIFLASFSAGLFISSALAARKPKSNSAARRFIMACLFLTLALLFYTILIFASKSLFPITSFIESHARQGFSRKSYFILLAAFSLSGLFSALLLKIILPIFLLFSASFSIFNFYLLKNEFGNQKDSLSLLIDEDMFRLESHEFPKNPDESSIVFEFCSIPPTIPLPLRRNWYSIKKSEEKTLSSPAKKFPKSLLEAYRKKVLLKNKSEKSVSLPDCQIFPSIYSLRISLEEGEFDCFFKRDL